VKILTWNQFQSARLECECGWGGHGRDAVPGESFEGGADMHCPSCGEYFGVVASPLAMSSVSGATRLGKQH
jgi:hypothetical protein